MQLNEHFEYEVAISFAGEQRYAAEAIAAVLKAAGVTVFYDKDEKAALWGKDLYVHLSEIYQYKAQYCILLASCEYDKKIWTNHERQAAQARALSEKGREYILPVRMDGTDIPGLPPSVGFLDYRAEGAEGVAKAFLRKTAARLAVDSRSATKSGVVSLRRQLGTEGAPIVRIVIHKPPLPKKTAEGSTQLEIAALLDTGASVTIINPEVARTCGLPMTGTRKLSAAGSGTVECPEYAAAISFPDSSLRPCNMVRVAAMPIGRQPISCLLGRNVLQNWKVTYNGRTGQIEIEEDEGT